MNGNPAIASARADSSAGVQYVRAADAAGNSWAFPVNTAFELASVNGGSLGIVDGRPAVSYHVTHVAGGLASELRYVRAADVDGSAWQPSVTVDTTGDVGLYNSLAVVSGHPAISYYNLTAGDLMYVRAKDPGGGSWGTPVPVDTTDDVGQLTSLTVINGNPAIPYTKTPGISFVEAIDSAGAAWVSAIAVDAIGEWGALALIDGKPAISYRGSSGTKYASASSLTIHWMAMEP